MCKSDEARYGLDRIFGAFDSFLVVHSICLYIASVTSTCLEKISEIEIPVTCVETPVWWWWWWHDS